MMREFTVEIDGNDGVGKTYLINKLKEKFPNLHYEDRGLFTKLTDLWNNSLPPKFEINKNTLYLIIDDSIEHCQERIALRGPSSDPLDEYYHNVATLQYYKKRFIFLAKKFKQHNVILIKRARLKDDTFFNKVVAEIEKFNENFN